MIESIQQKLKQAESAKDKDDVINHATKVKKAAIAYMKINNTTETPEININGHTVKFYGPNNLKMMVDQKEVPKEHMEAIIEQIDLISPGMKHVRSKKRIEGIAKTEVKNIASVAKVSAIRTTISAPVRMVEDGNRTTGSLLRGLWALLQKTMQR